MYQSKGESQTNHSMRAREVQRVCQTLFLSYCWAESGLFLTSVKMICSCLNFVRLFVCLSTLFASMITEKQHSFLYDTKKLLLVLFFWVIGWVRYGLSWAHIYYFNLDWNKLFVLCHLCCGLFHLPWITFFFIYSFILLFLEWGWGRGGTWEEQSH